MTSSSSSSSSTSTSPARAPGFGPPPEKETAPLAIQVRNLNFDYGPGFPLVLHNLSFSLPWGSRLLLTGSNGTGKTSLLRVLAGKHLLRNNEVQVAGVDVFSKSLPSVRYLSAEWRNSEKYRSDVPVTDLVKSLGCDEYPDRLAELLDLLDIDTEWRLSRISEGQRRRVQIMLSLAVPFSVLLLDEVTVDLDVLARTDLLNFLKRETDRGASVVYATHIFDGLSSWPTHIAHLRNGNLAQFGPREAFSKQLSAVPASGDSALLSMIEGWIREEFAAMKMLRKQRAVKQADAAVRRREGLPTEVEEVPLIDQLAARKENFFRFYNYWGN